jgi:hypothetical protein
VYSSYNFVYGGCECASLHLPRSFNLKTYSGLVTGTTRARAFSTTPFDYKGIVWWWCSGFALRDIIT